MHEQAVVGFENTDNAAAFHVASVIIHMIVAVLLCALVNILFRNRIIAALTGILFAVYPLHVDTVGIRDLILPGEMKELLNKVTEARKAAEAALITRREETAAMRSQANTARIFESNPTLMRLKELEVLERVAGNAKLEVVLSEPGLANRITKLL